MKISFLNEEKFNRLLKEYDEESYDYYEDCMDDSEAQMEECSRYKGEPIDQIHFAIVYYQEFFEYVNDDDEDGEVSPEVYQQYVANGEDEENYVITPKYKILDVTTTESLYNDLNDIYDDYDLDDGDFEGEVIDDIKNIKQYAGKYDFAKVLNDGTFILDYEPSLDMEDINSVNTYLERAYGVDNYNPLYILTDGVGLDSQTQYGVRGRDHHLTYESGSYTLPYLLSQGAIRCMPESPGITIAKAPNGNQTGPLFKWLHKFKGDTFYLDICDKDGDQTIASATFEDMRPQAVLAQISEYFNNGIKPRGSY